MIILNNEKINMVEEMIDVDTEIIFDLLNNIISTMTEDQKHQNEKNLMGICNRLNDLNRMTTRIKLNSYI